MSLSQYSLGDSLIHRTAPNVKILVLVITSTFLFIQPDTIVCILALLCTILLFRKAGFSWRIMFMQIKPALWLFVLLFAVQLAFDGWLDGVQVVTRLAALLLLASLLTLTTRSSDMVESLQRGLSWLRLIGINPSQISLAITLALRFIPVLASITADVREAQKARGLDGNVMAIAVPVIVRTLKMADDIAAAIEARSYDPDFG